MFQIDNTRPSVAGFEVQRTSEGVQVEFLASDPGGGVEAVEVALDGGDWAPLQPLDGVADSDEERYQLRLDAAEADATPRSIMVRVTDVAGNLGGDVWMIDE